MSVKHKFYWLITSFILIVSIIIYFSYLKTAINKYYIYNNIQKFKVDSKSLNTVSSFKIYQIYSIYDNMYYDNKEITIVIRNNKYKITYYNNDIFNKDYTFELNLYENLDKKLSIKLQSIIDKYEFNQKLNKLTKKN